MSVTFWTGPVSTLQSQQAVVPGSVHKVIECRGKDWTLVCKSLAASLLDANGRRVPALLSRLGVQDDGSDLYVGAFSAGGPVARSLLLHPEDAARVRAIMLADATYSDGWTPDHRPILNPDWLAVAKRSALGADTLFVATAGPSPNYGLPTSRDVLGELRRQIEEQTGLGFTLLSHFFGVTPVPDAAYRLGNVVLAEYSLKPLAHGGHVTIAGAVWKQILIPWLDDRGYLDWATGTQAPTPTPLEPTEPAAAEEPRGWGGLWLAVGILAGAAAGGVLGGAIGSAIGRRLR